MTLSMILTPLGLAAAPHLAAGAGRLRPLQQLFGIGNLEGPPTARRVTSHVVVAGYGLGGEALASALKEFEVPHVVVDLSLDNVRRAHAKGHTALLGDVSLVDVLHLVDIGEAREMVLLLNDPDATRRAVESARQVAPQLFILARAPYVMDVPPLKAAGADEVVTGEAEAAAAVVERVLTRRNVAGDTVDGLRRQIEGAAAE